MQDLVELNRRIARHAFQQNGAEIEAKHEQYLEFLAVCIARFRPSVTEVKALVFGVRPAQQNNLLDTHLNRDYLNYCRLAGKDVEAGRYERLIELGLNIDEAELLASLTNEQITRLALHYPGPIAAFDATPFKSGAGMHKWAGRFHASAYLAVASHHKRVYS